MATRSEFERRVETCIRSWCSGSFPEARSAAKEITAFVSEISSDLCFDPEPVKLGKLGISFCGSAPELVNGEGGTGQRPLTEAELREIIRRVEAVDNALYILTESPGDGWHDIVARAAQALRGAPSKPEPRRELVIEWYWNEAGCPDSVAATAKEVGGGCFELSYTPTQAVFALAERLGLSRKKGATQ